MLRCRLMDTKPSMRVPAAAEIDAWAEQAQRPMRRSALVAAQTRPALGLVGVTRREEANAIAFVAFREGFLEDLHVAEASATTERRISDLAMTKLMVESSAKLARILELRDEGGGEYAQFFDEAKPWTAGWERVAVTCDLAPLPRPRCASCSRPLDSGWAFCPGCGRAIAR